MALNLDWDPEKAETSEKNTAFPYTSGTCQDA